MFLHPDHLRTNLGDAVTTAWKQSHQYVVAALWLSRKLTVWVSNVVGGQDSGRRVVAALIDKVNRDRAAGRAAMIADGVDEVTDLRQGERCALGEEADAARAERARRLETDLAANALNLCAGARAHCDGDAGAHAHDVVAVVVNRVGVLVCGRQDVVPQLQDPDA